MKTISRLSLLMLIGLFLVACDVQTDQPSDDSLTNEDSIDSFSLEQGDTIQPSARDSESASDVRSAQSDDPGVAVKPASVVEADSSGTEAVLAQTEDIAIETTELLTDEPTPTVEEAVSGGDGDSTDSVSEGESPAAAGDTGDMPISAADLGLSYYIEPFTSLLGGIGPPTIGRTSPAIGDINSDGLNDIAVTEFDRLIIFYQNADGTLADPVITQSEDYFFDDSIAIGDLNNDGRDDLVSGVMLILQKADGTLDTPINYGVDSGLDIATDLVIADVNDDTLPDLVVFGLGVLSNIWVYPQQGDGSLGTPDVYSIVDGIEELNFIAAGDINGDGLNDVITAASNRFADVHEISVFYQKIDGTLDSPVIYDLGMNSTVYGLKIGDVTGDERNDIVFLYDGRISGPPNETIIGVFAQNTDGSLAPLTQTLSHPVMSGAISGLIIDVDLADVDRDGLLDVVVAAGEMILLVHYQTDGGTLTAYDLYENGDFSSRYILYNGMVVGDINGDCADDAVFAGTEVVVFYHVDSGIDCKPVDTPSDLVATMQDYIRIGLTWTDTTADNDAGFKVERSPTGLNDWTVLASTGANATAFTDVGPSCNTTFDYRVSESNAGGDSAPSTVATATTDACPPSPCDTVWELSLSECYALDSLYDSLGGDSWTLKTGWWQDGSPCDWYGIACLGGSVTELSLPDNNLVGTLPSALADLPNLATLDLNGNAMVGGIPSEVWALTGLSTLDLGGNAITGSLPAEIGNLTGLTALDLGENKINGTIPAELGNLTALITLDLSANAFSGEIPAALTGMTNLLTADFGQNALTSSDAGLLTLLGTVDSDWADTQSIAPTDVQIEAVSYSKVMVSWPSVAYTALGGYYEVSIGTSLGGPYAIAGTTALLADTSLLIEGLTVNTDYYIVVRTYTQASGIQQNNLWSAYSIEATGQTGAPSSPVGNFQVGMMTASLDGGGPYTLTLTIEGEYPSGCGGRMQFEQQVDGTNIYIDMVQMSKPGGRTCGGSVKPFSITFTLDGAYSGATYTIYLNGESIEVVVP